MSEGQKKRLQCYRCGKEGHFARDCPSRAHKEEYVVKETKEVHTDSVLKRTDLKQETTKIEGETRKTNIIDIGANLTNYRFKADLTKVIESALNAGVNPIIVTGTSVRESIEAEKLAAKYPKVLYSTAGVHPHDAKSCNSNTIETLKKLAASPNVCAIGETGLDFDRMFSPREVQEHWFEKQLELAAELKMPLFLHERAAHESFYRIMKKHRSSLTDGVVHCFTGTVDEVKRYLDMDLHIGFTGVICNKNRGAHLRDILKSKIIPLNRLMIETDAPFMTPLNMPTKVNRNEPVYLPYVLKVVAECYGQSEEAIARATTETAKKFFNLSTQ